MALYVDNLTRSKLVAALYCFDLKAEAILKTPALGHGAMIDVYAKSRW